MAIYMLFGVQALSIEAVRHAVERSLGIALEEREGLYRGGLYFSHGDSNANVGEYIEILNNIDLDDGEPRELEYPQYPFIIYLTTQPGSSPFASRLASDPELFVKLKEVL